MRRDGYSAAERLDFDLACRSLKRWADRRAEMTRMEAAPEPPSRPQIPVPVFRTLDEVLGLEGEAAVLEDAGLTLADVEQLGAELWAAMR